MIINNNNSNNRRKNKKNSKNASEIKKHVTISDFVDIVGKIVLDKFDSLFFGKVSTAKETYDLIKYDFTRMSQAKMFQFASENPVAFRKRVEIEGWEEDLKKAYDMIWNTDINDFILESQKMGEGVIYENGKTLVEWLVEDVNL